MIPKKAFLFDLDGVIVDTAKYHYEAWKKIASNLGVEFTLEQNELLKGVSRVRSLDIILELGNIKVSQKQKDQWLIQKNNDYLSYLVTMNQHEILPGVMFVLNFLKAQKQPIALASASKNARFILEKTGISTYFDVVVDGNDVGAAKPNPEVFIKAAKKVGVTPKNAIVFEDSIAGIQAANSAKMTSIGIGDAKILHEAQFHFKDFTFIDELFLKSLIDATISKNTH